MHTALECEVTIKPRFVYIPSPRTGPMRGGYCESRDSEGVERETGTWESWLRPSGFRALGFPQLLQSAPAAASGAKRVGLRMGRRGPSGAPWAAPGLAARQPLSRVQHAAPDLGSGGGWGSRAGIEGVTAGRAAAVRGLRGRPGGRGWEDLQSGLGEVVVELSRLLLSCPPLPSINGVEQGVPGMEPGSRSSGTGRLTDGRTAGGLVGLFSPPPTEKQRRGRRGVYISC